MFDTSNRFFQYHQKKYGDARGWRINTFNTIYRTFDCNLSEFSIRYSTLSNEDDDGCVVGIDGDAVVVV